MQATVHAAVPHRVAQHAKPAEVGDIEDDDEIGAPEFLDRLGRLRSTPGSSSKRKANRGGVGSGLVTTTVIPLARRRCASPASLPRPSPSGLTWVVRQTRAAGVRTVANSRAALIRAGAISRGMG